MRTQMQSPTIGAEADVAEVVRRWRWTAAEFDRASRALVFAPDERLELIAGEVWRKVSPQGESHYAAIHKGGIVLGRIFGSGWFVRAQAPLALGVDSLPEPDIAVVRAQADSFRATPTEAALVIEVADSSLRFDRSEKASLYARALIAEYWIVNLVERVLEVHREPAAMADWPHGHGYRRIARFTERESVSPLAQPEGVVTVADLLP